MTTKPWAGMDPNSAHQLWSAWTFIVYEGSKRQKLDEVTTNVLRWLKVRFGTTGRARVVREIIRHFNDVQVRWTIHVQVEGIPAHDPEFVKNITTLWEQQFVKTGFGFDAVVSTSVRILAGDTQDGKAASQLVVLPTLELPHDMPKELVTSKLIH